MVHQHCDVLIYTIEFVASIVKKLTSSEKKVQRCIFRGNSFSMHSMMMIMTKLLDQHSDQNFMPTRKEN